ATAMGVAAPGSETAVAHDVAGRSVLTAHVTIAGLKWAVVVEQPLEEAFAPIRASAQRTVVVAIVGVALAVGASLLLARRMVRPIQALQAGAARIGAGELGHRIDVRTKDELEALAGEFNQMTARLQESYATLEQRVEDRTRALSESLEQQTATGELLRVISSSPTDVQPVFDTIVVSAKRLLGAWSVLVVRFIDGKQRLAAFTPTTPDADDALQRFYPQPIAGNLALALDHREPLVIADVETDDRAGDRLRDLARRRGYRSVVVVPMWRKSEAIGTINVTRVMPGAFSDKDLALLRTFADQAVIAIENVRLFTELQQRNAEVTDALEQQTATGEILRVISSTPTDVQPVFDAIVANAVRLCNGMSSIAFRLDGETLAPVAKHGFDDRAWEMIGRARPPRPTSETMSGRAFVERRIIHTADILAEPGVSERSRRLAREIGYRAFLAVPMMREGQPIGVINITRREAEAFTPKQIEVMQTFADQAVIAVENVRLFSELQQRNVEVTEALEQQTATAEILRVMSSSPTDARPVFETIIRSAVRLSGAMWGTVFRVEDGMIDVVAHNGLTEEQIARMDALWPQPVGATAPTAHVAAGGGMLRIADIQAEDHGFRPDTLAEFRARGVRSVVVVPMSRHGQVIGTINLTHRAVAAFSDAHVALIQTFADQAVIAIENVRLFTELQQRNAEVTEALEQQTATAEILGVISRSQTEIQPVLDTIAASARRVCDAFDAVVFQPQGDELVVVAHAGTLPAAGAALARGRIGRDWVSGRAFLERRTIQVPDILEAAHEFPRGAEMARHAGHRTTLATPLLRPDGALGVLLVRRTEVRPFGDKQVALLRTFADQAVIAIENVRLFAELQERTTQLQVANRHKDEFLANMSHELRTPLNAIIGFSEVMLERMFGDVNDKQEEYLNDILSSGRHLLSLINDILDLSKIEAGRMELDLADFNLAVAIDNAMTLVHERAARRGLTLTQEVDASVGDFKGDERKIKQVLLNLLSNAIKFTPEGGRVEVRASLKGDVVEIAVKDTGVGIAPEDQETVFEEFRQVGTDLARKHEGTGLGLALSRRFVELHGGNLWLESEVGVGSTFTFALPVRRAE
ncbi:MAG TPA: GAF domain-containing protein, partial [Terriglobales bacterium]|nr:GAF domain-containing protein [Terriglobales bacterium]